MGCREDLEGKDGYIDMHCHIIPHVDDGSRSSSQTMSMLGIAYQSGIRTMIATPHYEVGRYEDNKEDILVNFNKIRLMAKKRYPDMELFLGNEIFFSYGVVDNLEEGKIFTLAGSKYVLIEFSPTDKFKYISQSLYEVINSGYRPILAHVERYEDVIADVDNVIELVEAGIYLQVNAGTIAGNMGGAMRRKIIKLIKNDLIHFISTDAHSNGRRSPDLTDCLKRLKRKVDNETINRLLKENARKVILNEYIDNY